jgi:hypothetical protein
VDISAVVVLDETTLQATVNAAPSPGGGGGDGGADSAYVYQQSTPATTWTINHGLGYRPSVELLDSGSQEIEGEVSHPTVNQTVVSLSPATAGLARLI